MNFEQALDDLFGSEETMEEAIGHLAEREGLKEAVRRLVRMHSGNFWCDIEDGAVDPGWTEARMQALSIEVGGMAVESMAKRLERQAQELLDLAKELRR